jgi:hypothetical protein
VFSGLGKCQTKSPLKKGDDGLTLWGGGSVKDPLLARRAIVVWQTHSITLRRDQFLRRTSPKSDLADPHLLAFVTRPDERATIFNNICCASTEDTEIAHEEGVSATIGALGQVSDRSCRQMRQIFEKNGVDERRISLGI